MLAPGLSILLMATIIGTKEKKNYYNKTGQKYIHSKNSIFIPFASWAILIDSIVCSITPSSAATTKTTISVTFAPLARIAEKAACPGVSRNVTISSLDNLTVEIKYD